MQHIKTTTAARKIKPPATGYITQKTATSGLFVRVSSSGLRSWEVVYRIAGKRSRLTIGDVAYITYEEAGASATAIKAQARAGISPRERVALSKMGCKTFAELVELYDTRHISRLSAPEEARSRLARWVLPNLGEIELGALEKGHFLALADKIEESGAVSEHARINQLCGRVCEFGVERGWLESNPVPRIKVAKSERDRYLLHTEIATLWRDASSEDGHCPFTPQHRLAWKLLVLSGQRISSVLNARRADFDLEAGEWTIPAEFMKGRKSTGQPHIVHLSPELVSIVKAALSGTRTTYLFTQRHNNRPASRTAFSTEHRRWLEAMGIAHAVVHDYRRTFSTTLAGLKVLPHVTEKLLAHRMTGVMAIYNKADYFEERASAIRAYSDLVLGSVASANNVVLIGTAKAS